MFFIPQTTLAFRGSYLFCTGKVISQEPRFLARRRPVAAPFLVAKNVECLNYFAHFCKKMSNVSAILLTFAKNVECLSYFAHFCKKCRMSQLFWSLLQNMYECLSFLIPCVIHQLYSLGTTNLESVFEYLFVGWAGLAGGPRSHLLPLSLIFAYVHVPMPASEGCTTKRMYIRCLGSTRRYHSICGLALG